MKQIHQFILFGYIVVVAALGCVGRSPQLSIVVDTSVGQAASHGLAKLTAMLEKKKIPFEHVNTMSEASAPIVLVPGLASGEGTAARLLRDAGRTMPDSPESLIIWPVANSEKQVWAVNGSDDNGLMYGLLDIAENI